MSCVCRDPRWGRYYESYGEDLNLVHAMTEIIPGFQGEIPANSENGVPFVAGKENVAACGKHFVGDGGTHDGINEGNTILLMISFLSWNGVKMHANHYLVTDILKNKLKFMGFVISDWEGIDRITNPPHKITLIQFKPE